MRYPGLYLCFGTLLICLIIQAQDLTQPKSGNCLIGKPCGGKGACIQNGDGYRCSCYYPYYENVNDDCKEINYCSTSPCVNGGTCIPIWGNYFCECPTQFNGRNCETANEKGISRLSTPLVLFNLEVTILNYTTAFLIFDGDTGSNMTFSLSFFNGSGLIITGHGRTVFKDVPAELAQQTDLWEIPALKEKFATVKKVLYYYTYFYPRQNAEVRPEVLIVRVDNGGTNQFEGKYSSNITKPELWCVPDATLYDCGETAENIAHVKKNSKVVIRSEFESECIDSEMTTSWSYYTLTSKQPFPFAFSYSDLDQGKNKVELDKFNGKTSAEIEAHTLNYGKYIIELHVIETPLKPTDRMSYTNIIWGWIRVVPANLVASIANGTDLTVAKYAAITLDASKSYDPNEPSNKNKNHLLFSWTCEPENELVCKSTTFAGSVVNIKNNLLNIGAYTFSVNVSVDPNWAGAKGKPSYYIPGPSSFTQTVVVIDDQITHLAIHCVKNCNNGSTINIQDTIYLSVVCLHECQGADAAGFYKWTAVPQLNLSLQTTQLGDSSDKLIINPNVLQADEHYRFIVVGGLRGMAVFALSTPPPLQLSNATCELNPQRGTTGITKFNLTCQGYPLTYDGFPLQYELYQTDDPDNHDKRILISYTFHPSRHNVVLMAGKPDRGYKVYLSFAVIDHYGLSHNFYGIASAEVESFTENVEDRVEELIGGPEGDLLEILEISGKMSDMVSLISAGVSALDSTADKDIEREEKLRDSFIEAIGQMPLKDTDSILQSLSVLNSVLGHNETARVSHNGVKNAAQILKDIVVNMYTEIVELKADIHFSTTELENFFRLVMNCADTIMATSEEIIKEFPYPPEEPTTMAELQNTMVGLDYPDYTDVNLTYILTRENLHYASASVVTAIEFVGMIVTNHLREGEKGKEIKSKSTTSYVKVDKPKGLADQLLPNNNTGGVQISRKLAIAIENKNPYVELHVALTSRNPFAWDPESKDINTDLLIVHMRDQGTGKKINFNEFNKPLDMFVSLKDPSMLASSYHNKITSNITLPLASISNDEDLEQYVRVHKISGKKGSKPYLVFQNPPYKLMVVVAAGLRPSVNDFRKYSEHIPHAVPPGAPLKESLVVNVQDSKETAIREKEFFYIAVLPEFQTMEKEASVHGEAATLTVHYTFELFLTSCPMWNDENLNWDYEKCQPGLRTSGETLHCECHHLSSIMGSMVVRSYEDDPLNPVNAHLILDNSKIVLIVIILLYLLFLPLFLWAHWKDKSDVLERALTILQDNIPGQKYPYLVIVFTDPRWNSGTTSNVFIEIMGTKQKCEIHHLIDTRRKQTHKRGSDNWFALHTSAWLGPLLHINLWHDNSGHHPSWRCEKVIIHDVRKDEAWTFLVERWLSVIHDDGSILRTVKPAPRREVNKYSNLFKEHLIICLREDHYILNTFLRHPRSTFTRKQRLAICFFMILGILMGAIWGLGYPNRNDPGTQIQKAEGDLISISHILYAIKFEIPTMAICFTITLLFRKTAPKEVDDMYQHGEKYESILEEYNTMLRSERENKLKEEKESMEEKAKKENETMNAQILLKNEFLTEAHNTEIEKPDLATVTSVIAVEKVLQQRSTTARTILDIIMMEPFILSGLKIYPGQRPYAQHFRTAWFLLMAILTYYLLYCGSLLGTVKSTEWLKTAIVSILFGACITQTGKAVLFAVILTVVYRTHAKPSQLHTGVWWDETDHLHRMSLVPPKLTRDQYKPMIDTVSPEVIQMLREKQLARMELGRLINDIIMFFIYIATLYFIVLASRDSLAYYSTKTLEDHVILPYQFGDIRNHNDFIDYLNYTLIPSVHCEELYNDDPIEENGVVTNYVTSLLGIIRLRQLRVKADCKLEPEISKIYDRCSLQYSTKNEDHNKYDIGWKPLDEKTYRESRATAPWLYRTPSESGTSAVAGLLHTYPGGGYFTAFGRTFNNSRTILKFLVDSSWFDELTRVVIIDFSIYNTNRNLFNVVTMTVETPVTGGLLVSHSITTEKLLMTTSELGWEVLIVLMLWLFMFILFFGIQLIRAWKESLLKYFTTPWIIIDVFIVMLGISMMIMNAFRNSYVTQLIHHLESVDGNEFVDFTWVGTWQIQLNYVVAVLVALSTARLWRLLRFGIQFQNVEKTLWLSAKCLMFVAFMMCIMLLCFASFAYIFTGYKMLQFASLKLSFFCLLLYGFGFFHIRTVDLEDENSFLGRTFLLLYWLLYVICLVNLFITVLMIYYEQSKIYVALEKKNINIKSYILYVILHKLGKRDNEVDTELESVISYKSASSNTTEKTNEPSVTSGKRYSIQTVCMAIPKPMPFYFNRIHSIPVIRTKAMKALTKDYIDLDKEKLPIMKPIVANELVEGCGLETPLYIEFYHSGLENNEFQFVPDVRLKEMERLLNGTLNERKINTEDYIEIMEEALNEEEVNLQQIEDQLDKILALLNEWKIRPRKPHKWNIVPEKRPKEIAKKDLSPSKSAETTDKTVAERVSEHPEAVTRENAFPKIDLYLHKGIKVKVILNVPKEKK